jgi:hypothetical protein
MHPNIIGALINSALYLACVFIAGIVTAHPLAWKLALVAMGMTYLSHYAQLTTLAEIVAIVLVSLSIAFGLFAGLALLF